MAVLILSSGCISNIRTRGETGEENKEIVYEMLNQTLKANGLESLEALEIDKKIIDIKARGFLTAQQIDKIETLEGSHGCKDFKITMEYKGEDLKAFNVETDKTDNCFIQRG